MRYSDYSVVIFSAERTRVPVTKCTCQYLTFIMNKTLLHILFDGITPKLELFDCYF